MALVLDRHVSSSRELSDVMMGGLGGGMAKDKGG